MGKLEGKVALITSIDDDIGLAAAKQFVSEGAYIFIAGRRAPELIVATENLGSNVTDAQVDVANLADLDRLFAQIKQEKGRIDIIFSNTGIAEEGDHSILDTYVKGLFFVMQKALPLMTNGASIILKTSFVANEERSSNLVVAGATAAIRSFGRTWATEFGDRRIRVNVVSPNSSGTARFNRSSDKRGADGQRSKVNQMVLHSPDRVHSLNLPGPWCLWSTRTVRSAARCLWTAAKRTSEIPGRNSAWKTRHTGRDSAEYSVSCIRRQSAPYGI